MPPANDKAPDALYAAPLDEFVARRDELARALRDEGERERARDVKALRKPTVAAWAVNQVARRERRRVRELLAAGKRLRQAQRKLVAGGERSAFRRASDAERDQLAALTQAAERIIAEAGHDASPAVLERVRETLHTAAVDEEVADLVRAGRLVREREAAGFGLQPAEEAPAGRDDRRSARRREATQRRQAAEERLREARRAVEQAERELRARRAEARRAEREAERTRAAADRVGR